MLTSRRAVTAFAALVLTGSTTTWGEMIDFNAIAPGGYSSIAVGDYVLSEVNVNDRAGNLATNAAEVQGSVFIGGPFTLTRTDGQPFYLTSVDAEGGSAPGAPGAINIRVYGYGEDENLDGSDNDGDATVDEPDVNGLSVLTDATAGLQTFAVTGGPSRLWAFGTEFGGELAHFDNLAVAAVPEPATAAALLALAGASLFRRCR